MLVCQHSRRLVKTTQQAYARSITPSHFDERARDAPMADADENKQRDEAAPAEEKAEATTIAAYEPTTAMSAFTPLVASTIAPVVAVDVATVAAADEPKRDEMLTKTKMPLPQEPIVGIPAAAETIKKPAAPVIEATTAAFVATTVAFDATTVAFEATIAEKFEPTIAIEATTFAAMHADEPAESTMRVNKLEATTVFTPTERDVVAEEIASTTFASYEPERERERERERELERDVETTSASTNDEEKERKNKAFIGKLAASVKESEDEAKAAEDRRDAADAARKEIEKLDAAKAETADKIKHEADAAEEHRAAAVAAAQNVDKIGDELNEALATATAVAIVEATTQTMVANDPIAEQLNAELENATVEPIDIPFETTALPIANDKPEPRDETTRVAAAVVAAATTLAPIEAKPLVASTAPKMVEVPAIVRVPANQTNIAADDAKKQ